VHHFAVGRCHWLKNAGLARLHYFARYFQGKTGECIAAALAVTSNINAQACVVIAQATLCDHSSEVLQCQERIATWAHQEAKIVAVHLCFKLFTFALYNHCSYKAKCIDDTREEGNCLSADQCGVNGVALWTIVIAWFTWFAWWATVAFTGRFCLARAVVVAAARV
jgi:hypothetical protein